MPNRWTEFVREFANKNNLSYGCALSKPQCKIEYHKKYPKQLTKKQQKEQAIKEEVERTKMKTEDINRAIKKPNISFVIEEQPEPVKKRGRKTKYVSEEDRKKAKREQTLASNKRIAEYRKQFLNEARERLKMQKEDMQGKGILKDIGKSLSKVGKAAKKGITQAVNFVGDTNKQVEQIASNIGKDVIDYGKAVVFGRNDYPPKIREILKKYGEEVVVSFKIKRTPVPSLLTSALSAVSLGAFGKKFGESEYDELFHLFLEMTTATGKRISVEKNEVINMDVFPKKRAQEETKQVTNNVPQDLTINTILENTEKYMGKTKFFSYSARDNNCQDFIVALLKSNNIGDEQDIAFVKQNTKELFENLPYLRKFSNTITDIGARVNVITTGAGLEEDKNYIVQSIVFNKDKWTTPNAKKWLRENNYKAPKVDRKHNTIRFRQIDPTEAEKDGFTEYRTKDLGDSGIQLILSYKKKILSNNIRMPRFVKGSEEAKAHMKMLRDKRMSGGAVKRDLVEPRRPPPCPHCGQEGPMEGRGHASSRIAQEPPPPEPQVPMFGYIHSSQQGPVTFEEMNSNPRAYPLLQVVEERGSSRNRRRGNRRVAPVTTGGKINIGSAFKKLGSDINKAVVKPAEKYVTSQKGGLATDLIQYGIPAASAATLGAVGSTFGGPVAGVAASALGSKLGAMGAKELQKKTGTGVRGKKAKKDFSYIIY